MRQVSFLPIAIFALNLNDEAEERAALAEAGLNVSKPLLGVYQGQEERSWLVPVTNVEQKSAVLSLARKYNQESVLFSGIDRVCTLHYLNGGDQVPLGVLMEVPETYAKKQSGYTYDPESGCYWVAK